MSDALRPAKTFHVVDLRPSAATTRKRTCPPACVESPAPATIVIRPFASAERIGVDRLHGVKRERQLLEVWPNPPGCRTIWAFPWMRWLSQLREGSADIEDVGNDV